MVEVEKCLTPETVIRRIKPVCSSCGLGLHIREVIPEDQHDSDFQIRVDPCPVCEKAAEGRSDWTQEQEPDLQELIDYALNSKATFFFRPVRNLSPAEVMAALGYVLREIDRMKEADKLSPSNDILLETRR